MSFLDEISDIVDTTTVVYTTVNSDGSTPVVAATGIEALKYATEDFPRPMMGNYAQAAANRTTFIIAASLLPGVTCKGWDKITDGDGIKYQVLDAKRWPMTEEPFWEIQAENLPSS